MSGHRRPPVAVIVVLLLAIIGGGAWWWWSTTTAASSDPRLVASGSAEATEYQLSPAITGRLVEVLVEEGDTLAAGDPVATLDDEALRLQVDQAEQGVRAAEAAVTNAKDDGSKADVTAAKARLEQAKASVSLAKIQLGHAKVTSPRAGTVVSVAANAGQNASAGRTLVTMVDPSEVFVRVFVPEPRMGEIAVGQQVTVTSDAGETTGQITFIASTAEFTPDSVQTEDQRVSLVYQVRVRLDDTSRIKAGMPADVTFG